MFIFQIHHAIENYILHNVTNFCPIDFEIVPDGRSNINLRAQLYAEELVVLEGHKRVVSIILAGIEEEGENLVAAKIRHPISGIFPFQLNAAEQVIFRYKNVRND